MKRFTGDFETRSASDLRKEGAYKYSLHPTTRPTCFSIKIHHAEIIFFDFYQIGKKWAEYPIEFRRLWTGFIQKGYEFSAHNAFFERCIYENILVARYGWPPFPPEKYHCTAAKAAACALPRNLEGAGAAMSLPVQKDKGGYVAMMATCKPTRAWKAWEKKGKIGPEPPMFLEPDTAPEMFRRLYYYCKIDTKAEEMLDDALPDLSPIEQKIWLLNQKLNWRGLRIDIPTVKKIVGIMAVENKKKLKELDKLTMGLVTNPNSRNSVMEFLELEGVKLANLQKQTVDDQLSGFDISPTARDILEIRKALTLASTKKYQSFLTRANEDERVRDILIYHGASTGRDTGTGVQPHNFPRGILKVDKKRPYTHVENVVECDHETLTMLYGNSLGMLFSSILRNMIIPSPGCELFVADYSKIEVAVCWWLAGNEPGLRILRAGKDPYIYQGASNFNITYDQFIEKYGEDGETRQLPKAQVLGCQFGMGWEKFLKTAWIMYRLKLTEAQSKFAVEKYREQNAAVPLLWKMYETAAVNAVENRGKVFKAGKCDFQLERGFLWITLPSGRKLAYRNPQVTWIESQWGPRKTLEFWGVNPKTRKWAIERTWGGVICENITQAVARDLMMYGMLRLEAAKYRALFMVHDEGVTERKIGRGSIEEFIEILCRVPSWGEGLPIYAKGWTGPRYRK